MADISAGQHADIVLSAVEVLRVVTQGNTDVVGVYGAPAGTTPVNSASLDFGPYGVPSKLQINCGSGTASYFLNTYSPSAAVDNGAVVSVLPSDSGATIKSKIETINAAAGMSGGTEWPDGVGRMVSLPAKRLSTPALTLSQAQSLSGIKGSTILAHDGSAILDLGGGVGAYITIANDYRSHSGIAGQGVIRDLDIDASATQTASGPATIHGLYAPARSGNATAHTYDNVTVYGAKNDGINIDSGNDKLVARRLRQEGSLVRGIVIAGSDCKGSDFGSVSVGTAFESSSAAVEIDKFDFWRAQNPTSAPTVKITGATNGCVIKSGTVEGDMLYIGKNENAGNRFINAKAQFAFVHFKNKSDISRTCHIEAQSVDLLELISCKFGASGSGSVTPYDYLIKITGANPGIVKIIGASGICRFLGRVGAAANRMTIDALHHICDRPDRLLFEWGRLGTVEIVPNWVTTDATLKTHLPFDGGNYNTVEYPAGWLNLQAYLGNMAADLATAPATFVMPELPVVSSYAQHGLRCIL